MAYPESGHCRIRETVSMNILISEISASVIMLRNCFKSRDRAETWLMKKSLQGNFYCKPVMKGYHHFVLC